MDNPAAPIPSTSPQPAVSSLPAEALAKAGPAESPNRRWILWSAGALVFLILGVTIGIFSAKFFSQSQGPSQLTSTPTPEPSPQSPTPTLIPDPTANWKTFKDQKNSIEFKYPLTWHYRQTPDWTFDVYLEDRPFEIPKATEFISSIQIHFNEVQNTVTNQKYFMEKTIGEAQTRIANLFNPQSIKIIENLTIDGKQTIQISGITGPGPLQGEYFKYTIIQLDNKVLFVVLYGKEHEAVYNQILSTFQFID